MGYAKLNFATTVTTANALFDIVRVITGNVANVSNLTFASTTNSEIVNTLNQNWSVTYGSVEASTTQYVLESPCVTAGKKHYTWWQSSNGTTWGTSAAFSTSSSGVGFSTVSSATDASTVTNSTYYSTTAGTTGLGRYVIRVDATNTNLYLSWSNNHVAIYGLRGSGATTSILGSFEYPETSLTQFTNTSPVCQYNIGQASANTFITTTTPGTGTTEGLIFQGISVHQPSTSTTSGVYNFGTSGYGTVTRAVFNPVVSLDSSGNNAYPFVPLYWSLPTVGIPVINISELSKVYRLAHSAASPETVFTVGSNNYVYFTFATSTTSSTGNFGIAFLRA